MKIEGTLPLPTLERMQGRGVGASRTSTDSASRVVSGGPDVAVAGGARFVNEVRSDAVDMPNFRADEVARARADVASGSLFSEAELDAAVDALLSGL